VESNLVLGQDITMEEATDLADKTLVGKAYGHHFSFKILQSWVSDTWVGAPPQLNRLTRGWFMLNFSNPNQAENALLCGWSIDSTPVLLKKWEPSFDAAKEIMETIPIWVRLPGLPPQYWLVKCFQAIGNELGFFLKADMSFKETREMVFAQILVSLNIRVRLQKQFKIMYGGRTHMQLLDYEGVPFHCRCCHEHGHILKDYPLPFRGCKIDSSPAQNKKCYGSSIVNSTSSYHSLMDHSLYTGGQQPASVCRLPASCTEAHLQEHSVIKIGSRRNKNKCRNKTQKKCNTIETQIYVVHLVWATSTREISRSFLFIIQQMKG
jgi:hypothetical protein